MARIDPYPNRWREVNAWDATDELTDYNGEMCLMASENWVLPDSHVAIVRAYHKNGTIEERSYRHPGYAHRYMRSLLSNKSDFTLLTWNAIQDTLPEDAYD